MKTQHLIPILFLAAFCTACTQTNTPTTPGLLTTNLSATNEIERVFSASIWIIREEVQDEDQKDGSSKQVVYVLTLPYERGRVAPIVYKTFDSKIMEDDITRWVKDGTIKPGTTIFYRGVDSKGKPTIDYWNRMKSIDTFCQKLGLSFSIAPHT